MRGRRFAAILLSTTLVLGSLAGYIPQRAEGEELYMPELSGDGALSEDELSPWEAATDEEADLTSSFENEEPLSLDAEADDADPTEEAAVEWADEGADLIEEEPEDAEEVEDAEELPGEEAYEELTGEEGDLPLTPEEEAEREESILAVQQRLRQLRSEIITVSPRTKNRKDLMTGVNVGEDVALFGNTFKSEASATETGDLPEDFDFRNVSPEGTAAIDAVSPAPFQGHNSSCWAYAVTGAVETSAAVELRRDISGIDDSETYLAYFAHSLINEEGALEYKEPGGDTLENPFNQGSTVHETAQLLTSSLGPMREDALPSMPRTEEEIKNAVSSDAFQSLTWDNSSYLSDHMVTDVNFLPQVNRYDADEEWSRDEAGITAIKTAIAGGSGVVVDIYIENDEKRNSPYINYERNLWYTYRSNLPTNHQVEIIGWDDTIPAEQFSRAPRGDGAFICRDSHGTYEDLRETYLEGVREDYEDAKTTYLAMAASGDIDLPMVPEEEITEEILAKWMFDVSMPFDEDGFFYLSYYDMAYANPASFTVEARGGISNEYMYQYDYLGMASCSGTAISEKSGTVANVFAVKDAQLLKHIAVFTAECASRVSIDAYALSENAETPVQGTLLYHHDAELKWAGYHVLPVSGTVTIPEKTTFSVVVKTTGPEGTPYTPFEYGGIDSEFPNDVYRTKKNEENASFILTDSGWKDMAEYKLDEDECDLRLEDTTVGNAMIRVFTDDVPVVKEEVTEGTEEIVETVELETFVGRSYSPLFLRGSSPSKGTVKLKWKKIPGAAGYTVYGANNGKSARKIADVTSTSYTNRKLKKGIYRKYYVEAWYMYEDIRLVLERSPVIYVAVAGGKYTNYKSVKITSGKTVTLKKKKTKVIRATAVKAAPSLKVSVKAKLRYESSKPSVATVSKTGKIKAKQKGTAYIRVYAQNGVCATVKVKVK